MINLGVYHKELDPSEVRKYAGLKFILRHCLGEGVCRMTPPHEKHDYYEQILLTDEVAVPPKSKESPPTADLPIRWWNFCHAYWQILAQSHKEQRTLAQLRAVQDALVYARMNCFDIDGSPSNMARSLQYKSY